MLVQFLADILGIPIACPKVTETTALGAAFLAGLQVGIYSSLAEVADLWQDDKSYQPAVDDDARARLYKGWRDAVERVRSAG